MNESDPNYELNINGEWGIKTRVLFLNLVPTIIISILLGTYFTSARLGDLETTLKERGFALALQLAPASEYGIFSGDSKALHRITMESLAEPEILSVSIYNDEGKILAHAGQDMPKSVSLVSVTDRSNGITMADTGQSLLFNVPVVIKDVILEDYPDDEYVSTFERTPNDSNVIGWINLEVGRTTTQLRQYQVLFACSIILLFGLGISGFFAFRMGREVTDPLLEIAHVVERIREGNLDIRVNTGAPAELRHLESGINTMAASMKRAHEEMQQSIEQATADLRATLETIEIQNVELEFARKEAETASRVKSEFLANMSHEIRTPLNGVIGFINLLRKTELSLRQKDYLHTIGKSAESLLNIINDILDFSKIEAGKLSLDIAPMDLRECIEETLTLLAPAAHDKGIELVHLIYNDVPLEILGDSLRLKQIVTNLLNNAIKFTQQGTVVIRVMLEDEQADQVLIKISVTDTGIGLTQDQQDNLFQAFHQADTTHTRRFGGTGLGLVISQRLVAQMGGMIGVKSTPQAGSEFYFTLAARLPEAMDRPALKLPPTRVLIYEAHPTSRLSLLHTLTSFGCEVVTLDKIEDVHTILAHDPAHGPQNTVMLLGLNQLASLSSLEHFIKEMISEKQLPVIVMANTIDQKIYEEFLEWGTTAFLAKPITQFGLYETLCNTLGYPVMDQRPFGPITQLSLPAIINPIKLLVVDDYQTNLKLVRDLLLTIDSKILVDTASNGPEAITMFENTTYDLILMDVQMPGMDGLEVTHRLRCLEAGQGRTPIIALTAMATQAEREALLDAGLDDYITKPIFEHHLIEVITRWTHHGVQASTQPAGLSGLGLESELLATLPEELDEILRAYHSGSIKLLREKVHRLHGACCYCAFPDLLAAVSNLERAILDKVDDLAPMIHSLTSEIHALLKDEPTLKITKNSNTDKVFDEINV